MSSNASEPVTINILDRKYQFACPESEREDLKKAAIELDNALREIKDSGRLMSLERIALQAALNFCDETLKLRRAASDRVEKIDNRIRLLAEELDEAINS